MKDKLLSTKAAAELRGCTTSNIRYNLKPDYQEKDGNKRNYYLTSSVMKLHPVRPSKRVRNVKRSAPRYKEKEDPHGVMVKPTYRGRKCPGCGEPIETGRYRCRKCSVHSYGMRETEDLVYSTIVS